MPKKMPDKMSDAKIKCQNIYVISTGFQKGKQQVIVENSCSFKWPVYDPSFLVVLEIQFEDPC